MGKPRQRAKNSATTNSQVPGKAQAKSPEIRAAWISGALSIVAAVAAVVVAVLLSRTAEQRDGPERRPAQAADEAATIDNRNPPSSTITQSVTGERNQDPQQSRNGVNGGADSRQATHGTPRAPLKQRQSMSANQNLGDSARLATLITSKSTSPSSTVSSQADVDSHRPRPAAPPDVGVAAEPIARLPGAAPPVILSSAWPLGLGSAENGRPRWEPGVVSSYGESTLMLLGSFAGSGPAKVVEGAGGRLRYYDGYTSYFFLESDGIPDGSIAYARILDGPHQERIQLPWLRVNGEFSLKKDVILVASDDAESFRQRRSIILWTVGSDNQPRPAWRYTRDEGRAQVSAASGFPRQALSFSLEIAVVRDNQTLVSGAYDVTEGGLLGLDVRLKR